MTLYFRDGHEFTGTPGGTENKPTGVRFHKCDRCGGPGRIDAFRHVEGGICFKCEGKRGFNKTESLYTTEQLAKLNDTAAKRHATKVAKLAAARAEADAKIAARREAFEGQHGDVLRWLETRAVDADGEIKPGFLGDMLSKARRFAEWSDAQRDAVYASHARYLEERAKAAKSEFVGAKGERITATVTVEREASFWRANNFRYRYGDNSEEVFITTLRDTAGNALVVKSPRFREAVGSTLTIKGTVAEHSTYRDENQTILKRVAVIKEKESLSAA